MIQLCQSIKDDSFRLLHSVALAPRLAGNVFGLSVPGHDGVAMPSRRPVLAGTRHSSCCSKVKCHSKAKDVSKLHGLIEC